MSESAQSLVTTARLRTVVNNGVDDNLIGTSGSDAYLFTLGKSGNDTLVGFTSSDSLLVDHRIFDGNRDGIIGLGVNGVLDIDRVSRSQAGDDGISFVGLSEQGLRYLGTVDGVSAYADASTRKSGWIEGTIGNDTFDAVHHTAKTYFYDTALGLDFGYDIIQNWSSEDRLVTTSPLHGWDLSPEVEYADEVGDYVSISESPSGSRTDTYYLTQNADGSRLGTSVRIEASFEPMILRLGDVIVEDDTSYYVYYGRPTGSG